MSESKIIQNPYIEAYNKQFNRQLVLRESDTEEGGLSIGKFYNGYFSEMFCILPFNEPLPAENERFQLIEFTYIPATRHEPPDCIDHVIGSYPSLNNTIVSALKLILMQTFESLIFCVGEEEAEKYINEDNYEC